MKTNPLVVERVYPASSQEIWEALTDNDKIGQWYFKLPEFKPVVGFEFRFDGGEDPEHPFHHICVITSVLPLKKLSYTWRFDGYPGDSEVSFELFEEGENTRVRITHTGIEMLDPGNPAFSSEEFGEGWSHILNKNLKDFLKV
jgi:uncharacterized protein YndB with AHSA1/START domain